MSKMKLRDGATIKPLLITMRVSSRFLCMLTLKTNKKMEDVFNYDYRRILTATKHSFIRSLVKTQQ